MNNSRTSSERTHSTFRSGNDLEPESVSSPSSSPERGPQRTNSNESLSVAGSRAEGSPQQAESSARAAAPSRGRGLARRPPAPPPHLLNSTVEASEVEGLHEKYHIPREYEILVPEPSQFMHQPPHNCRTFHLAVLGAGLRFPIAEPIVDILRRMNLCPTQLSPNSYRILLSFIIIMRVYGVEPSWGHFWDLFTCSKSPQPRDKPSNLHFFYLSGRKAHRFLKEAPSSHGGWKDKFVFIRCPPNHPWRLSREWRPSTPNPARGETNWGSTFLSETLTLCHFDVLRLTKDSALSLAGLSPAPRPRGRTLGKA